MHVERHRFVEYTYIFLYRCISLCTCVKTHGYVITHMRLHMLFDSIIGLFCKRALYKRLYSAKETCKCVNTCVTTHVCVMTYVCVAMCNDICMCRYTCTQTCACKKTHVCIKTHVCTRTHVCTKTYVCTKTHVCTKTYACIKTKTYARIKTKTHRCITTYVCVFTHACIMTHVCTKTKPHIQIQTYVYMGWLRLEGSSQRIGLFCKRALLKRIQCAKEAYDFKEPTSRSHPIPLNQKLANSRLATQFTTHIDMYIYKDTTTCRYTDICICIYITSSLQSACDSIYHTYRHMYLDRGSLAIVEHSSAYKLSNIHECEYMWPLISFDGT